jgi:hypothetical protein
MLKSPELGQSWPFDFIVFFIGGRMPSLKEASVFSRSWYPTSGGMSQNALHLSKETNFEPIWLSDHKILLVSCTIITKNLIKKANIPAPLRATSKFRRIPGIKTKSEAIVSLATNQRDTAS